MRKHLQTWANDNVPADELKFKDGYWRQIMFVRDRIGAQLFGHKQPVYVVGTHTSKSVLLPVYRIEHPELTIQLRDNFHNIIVSVISKKAIPKDSLMDAFDPDHKVIPVYAEGFDKDWVFGTYLENPREWTAEVWDELNLYALLYRITYELGVHNRQGETEAPPVDDQAGPAPEPFKTSF